MFTLDPIFDNMLRTNGDVKQAHLNFEKMRRSPQFNRAIHVAAMLASQGAPRDVIVGASHIDQDTLAVLEICPPNKRDFLIPVTYKTKGLVRVTADTLYDAIVLAKEALADGSAKIESKVTIQDSMDISGSVRDIRKINEMLTSDTNPPNVTTIEYEMSGDIPADSIPEDVINALFKNISNLFGHEDDESEDDPGSDEE